MGKPYLSETHQLHTKAGNMNKDYLKTLITEQDCQRLSENSGNQEVTEILPDLFDHAVSTLAPRIDDIKVVEGRAIAFFTDGREFLTINVTRTDLRIYIHPPARVFFDPDQKFNVEKFNFWKSSFQKKSGKYRGMSVWISKQGYLEGVKKVIDLISKF